MPDIGKDITISRDEALALHKSGNIAAAISAYEVLLQTNPDDADCLGLLALALHQSGKAAAAQDIWLASLALTATPEIQLRNLNNLVAAAVGSKMSLDDAIWSRIVVPQWPVSRIPTAAEFEMMISAARGLLKFARRDEALRLVESTAQFATRDLAVARNFAEILVQAGRPEAAHRLLANIPETGPGNGDELILAQAATAYAAGLREEAARLTKAAVAAIPAHITAALPGQRLLIGVVNPAPRIANVIMSPQLFHFSGNSPASLAWKHNDLYRFWSVFPESADALTALAGLPKADLILNNWVNAELLSTPNTLKLVSDFIDGLGLPVLNHPRHAALATRQRNAERLTGIAGLLVPRITRFRNDPVRRPTLVRSLGETIGYPLIIRDTFSQMGKEAAKIDSGSELASHLEQAPAQELYAIEFVNNPVGAGFYRKARAAVIGGEVIISHVHFGERWNVHRARDARRGTALSPPAGAEEFARSILLRPEAALGKMGIAALQEIKARIPLDLYGIDFDILPDGRLVFFEANAAMNISIAGHKSKGTEPVRARMREALHRLFIRAAGGAKAAG